MKEKLLWMFVIPSFLFGETIWHHTSRQPFEITLKLDRENLILGEKVLLEAFFLYPDSYILDKQFLIDQINWSANPLKAPFNTISIEKDENSIEKGLFKHSLSFILIPARSEAIDFSFLDIHFEPKNKSESPVLFETPIFHLEIAPPPPFSSSLLMAPLMLLEPEFPIGLTEANALALNGPESLEKERRRNQRLLAEHTFPWFVFIFLIGCGGLGWVIYLMREWLFVKKENKVKNLLLKESIQHSVEELKKQKEVDKKNIRSYCAQLSSILFDAIEHSLGMPVKIFTTEELRKCLDDHDFLSKENREELINDLMVIDEIKFAHHDFSLEGVIPLLHRIQEVITKILEIKGKGNQA